MGTFPTKIVLTKEVFLCEHRMKKVVTQIMKNPLFCFVYCFLFFFFVKKVIKASFSNQATKDIV